MSRRLYTPEEAAEQLGHVTGYEIRAMCRRREIAYVKRSRKILLTAEQIDSIIDVSTINPQPAEPAEPAPEGLGFRTTSRSRALSNRAS